MRRAMLACAVVLAVASTLVAPASAAPTREDASPVRAMLGDRDHDGLDDVLERRLRKAEAGSRHAMVVSTDGSVTLAEARRSVGSFTVSRRLEIIGGFAARLTAGQARALARIPGVLRIEHDAVVHATMDAARADYGADAARASLGLTGAGVNVCVLDTGVDPGHEQLNSKAIVWQNFVEGSGGPFDDHGHGTHVAAIAVGDGTGGSSAARYGGVAPAAGLWAGRVLNADGSGSESGIIAGIEWCRDAPAVDVISMSLGTLFPSDGSDNLSLAANDAVQAGKIVIAAAGNSGDGPDTISAPGAAADVITIGATASWSAAPGAENHSDGIFLAYFSSRGGDTFAGDQKPDIVAPGVNVLAAEANTTSGYILHSGTSMATPFAAGSAALALEAAPDWTSDELQTAMETTAEDYGPAGKDPDWGAGAIDVLALTALASGGSDETTFPAHVHLSGVVPDGGEWEHAFEIGADELDVPIAASVVLGGECVFFFPGFGCLDPSWSPDLDAQLFDPNGELLDISQCTYVAPASEDPHVDNCGFGRQETVHSMPTVAGSYLLRVYAYQGSPNDGAGGPIEVDLSTGPAGSSEPPPPPPPPPTTIHVGDLDRDSWWLTARIWRGKAIIRVHDELEGAVEGVLVTGRWGTNGSVQCTTNVNGACNVTRDLKRSRASIAFTVLQLSKASYTYVAVDNHDELDEDNSNGTKITVNRPPL